MRIGGWGYLLDESGSAYDIGRAAIRVALEEEDSLSPACYMSRLLKERMGTQKIWDAVGMVYTGGKAYVASLADVVFDAYKNGDANAANVIRTNAARLGEMLNVGITKYGAKPRAVVGGGIFEHYWDIMSSNIKRHTDAQLIEIGLPPVYGACRMALKLLGKQIPVDFYDNFKSSYRGE